MVWAVGGWRLVVGGGLSAGVGGSGGGGGAGGVEVLCAAAFRVGRLGVLDAGSRVGMLVGRWCGWRRRRGGGWWWWSLMGWIG